MAMKTTISYSDPARTVAEVWSSGPWGALGIVADALMRTDGALKNVIGIHIDPNAQYPTPNRMTMTDPNREKMAS